MHYQTTVRYDGRIKEQWSYDTADKEDLQHTRGRRKVLREDAVRWDITTQRIFAEQFQRLLEEHGGRKLLVYTGVD